MGFLDPTTDFRWIDPGETDANSPLSEELMSQLRENIESNAMNRIYTGFRAEVITLDSDTTKLLAKKVVPTDANWVPNVAALTVLTFRSGNALGVNFGCVSNDPLLDGNTYDVLSAGASTIQVTPDPMWDTDYYENAYVYVTSGGGAGNYYEVASNTTDTLTVSSGNPSTDGVDNTSVVEFAGLIETDTDFAGNGILGGDELLSMYAQTGYAHTHDGIDSAPVGVDVPVGDGRTVSPESAAQPAIRESDIAVQLNNNVKSIYILIRGFMDNEQGYTWATRGVRAKFWVEFDLNKDFTWIDSSGAVQTNANTNVNDGAGSSPTVYTEITDFSNVNSAVFYSRVAKLDITPLGIGHSDLRRYTATLRSETQVNSANFISVQLDYELIGSSRVA